jgi:hypothetical protein
MFTKTGRPRRSVARFASMGFAFLIAASTTALYAHEFDAHEFEYPDFAYALGLKLNGEAKTVVVSDDSVNDDRVNDKSVLRIVPAKKGQAGTFFYDTLVPVTAFNTQFSFRLSDPGGCTDRIESGGDGFVFAIQPVDPALGGNGGGGQFAFCGIAPSVGVEFDLFKNPQNSDVSSNHLGVNIDGETISRIMLDVADRFDNGKIWFAWIDYDGTTLEVRANQTGVRPNEPLLSYEIDIPATLNADAAYVGFTAATGCAHANHDILSWRFEDSPPLTVPGQPQPPSSK